MNNTENIIADTQAALNSRNLLNLAESAELTRLAAKFDRTNGELTDREEAFVWKHIDRLKAAV